MDRKAKKADLAAGREESSGRYRREGKEEAKSYKNLNE